MERTPERRRRQGGRRGEEDCFEAQWRGDSSEK